MKGTKKGFVVSAYSIVGDINEFGDIRPKWVDGGLANASNTVFHRSYTDEKGVYHLDGMFDTIEQVKEHLYKLVGQAVQEMLRMGWVDIKVNEKRAGRSRAGVIVTVYGKTKDGKCGWKRIYGISKETK